MGGSHGRIYEFKSNLPRQLLNHGHTHEIFQVVPFLHFMNYPPI